MNKQELIKKYKRLEGVWDAPGAEAARQIFLQDLDQLDESQKVTVPQFVADVIEGAREQSAELEDAFEYAQDAAFRGKLGEWFMKLENRNTFARAWLDGYEVEKEKRYLVTIKGVVRNFRVLKHNINEDTWYMSNKINYTDLKAYHTKKELEDAGFGEVFDSSLFEVEEVEDE